MPRARKRCSHRDCDEVMPCPVHKPVDRRPSRHERGYDAEHDRRAAALREEGETYGIPCALCWRPIDYQLRAPHPMSFAAHHSTADKDGPIAATHRACNRAVGQPV